MFSNEQIQFNMTAFMTDSSTDAHLTDQQKIMQNFSGIRRQNIKKASHTGNFP